VTDGNRRFDTLAVSGPEEATRGDGTDVIAPIHLSSTFEWDVLDREALEYTYSRGGNPTRAALESQLATLAGGEYGLAFASGTAAIATTMLSLVRPGGHVVAFDTLYTGTEEILAELVRDHFGVDVSFVDAREAANVADAVGPETDLLWVETPTNPLMRLCDVGALANIADAKDVVLGVDNTFASPYFQKPLELGADLVVHSTTKYLNGHSDSIGGAVVTDDETIHEALAFSQTVGLGNVLSPFDSYLVARGVKTLPARMERHRENALAIARFLEGHDRAHEVRHPELESHPQHELASEQMDGGSGMLSFVFDGTPTEVEAFLMGLEEFSVAVSLGGVESLIEAPALMGHDCGAPGTVDAPETLIRISVGIEHVEDLLADLRAALS